METITTNQLKLYDKILEEINAQHEMSEKIKQEIEKQRNKIVALKMALAKNLRLCYCSIKVFDSVCDLYFLYKTKLGPDSLSAVSNNVNCKFYLVEFCISSLLLDIFKDYYVTISMYNGTISTNRTIKPSSNKGLIYEVIPISEDVLDIWVEIRLSFPSEGSWIVLKLFRKQINILHHFIKYEDKKTPSRMQKYISLNRSYNSDKPESVHALPFLEYKFLFGLTTTDMFTELFLSRCYHRLDVKLFSELVNDNMDKPVTIIISFRYNNKCTVSYNKRKGSVRLKCNLHDLYLIKKILIMYLTKDCKDISGDWIDGFIQASASRTFNDHMNISEVHAIQEDRRMICFELPFQLQSSINTENHTE